MAITETNIANQALLALGELVITNIDTDTTKRATTIKELFAIKRDYLLRKYQWKFAITRETLIPDETPAFGWARQFELPSDYIQLIELYPKYLRYKIESNVILCDETDNLNIRYTRRVIDPEEFDATFIEAFAALLAREAAIPLTDSLRKQTKMDELYEDKLADARFSGSIEDDLEEIEADDWLNQRF